MRFSPTTVLAFKYLLTILFFLATADFFYARANFPGAEPRLDRDPSLINRTAWYKQQAGEYNLVFIGDSRTYCGIHPDLFDPQLGTNSINLSLSAHWFPTQLAQYAKLARSIPKNTTVVWSVGTQNFLTPSSIQRTYPVGFYNAIRYWWWGAQRKGLLDNLLYYNPALLFLGERENIKQRFETFLARPVPKLQLVTSAQAATSQNSDPHMPEAMQLLEEYGRNPAVWSVGLQTAENGQVISVVVNFKRGGYYRIELDEEYFRRRQRVDPKMGAVSIDPISYRMFEEILQIFKSQNIKLVVNEIEEAPHSYSDRQWHRNYMREVIEKRVRDMGFSYVRVDFDRLSDDDYFDYNHLNSRGIAKFTPMLADQLRPYVSPHSYELP